MPTTLTYGFVKPVTGDLGSSFFPALEGDIQKLNDHTHDGSNTARIPASSVTCVVQSLTAQVWSSTGTNGLYRTLVTVPAAFTDASSVQISVRDSLGEPMYLKVEFVTTTTFYIYTNDSVDVPTSIVYAT